MKQMLCILIAASLLPACNQPNTAIKERISNSDSVAINYFRGDGTMDTVVMVKIIRNKEQIERLSALISQNSVTGNNKCGYDGSLHFFKMNQVIQDIDFRMATGDCMFFSFLQLGKPQATELSQDAKALINSFRK
ncbi:MAG: hypothetical protein ABIQ31_00820 [Ferruginibacter sp.]